MLERCGELPDCLLSDDELSGWLTNCSRRSTWKNPMSKHAKRGEVWLVDLGMIAKVRPCLVVSIPAEDDNDRVLTTVLPHTTSTRESRFEVGSRVRFLKVGAFDAQNLVTIPNVNRIRCLGTLQSDQLAEVESTIKRWLGFA